VCAEQLSPPPIGIQPHCVVGRSKPIASAKKPEDLRAPGFLTLADLADDSER